MSIMCGGWWAWQAPFEPLLCKLALSLCSMELESELLFKPAKKVRPRWRLSS
jgi:hypothetical protein